MVEVHQFTIGHRTNLKGVEVRLELHSFAMRSPEEILDSSLTHFKATLSQHQVLEYQLERFTDTTSKDVKLDILQIQHAREQDKSLMNLARFESFIHAYEQFDEVCQAMELDNPELSSFIWGPPRFILQV